MSQPGEGRMPTPLPANELAPLPSKEAMFGESNDYRFILILLKWIISGSVKTIKQQHDLERQEMEKQQQVAKARMDQGLQDKIAQRRSRKDRVGSIKEKPIKTEKNDEKKDQNKEKKKKTKEAKTH